MKRKQKETAPASEEVIAGGSELLARHSKLFFRLKSIKPWTWLVLLAVVVLIGGGLYLKGWLERNETALEVGNYRYTKEQYDKLIHQAAEFNVSRPLAKEALVKAMAARAAADKLQLNYPTDKTSQDNAARTFYDLLLDAPVSDYQRATAWSVTIRPYVAVSELGGYKTTAVFFPFSRYVTDFHESYLTETFDKKLVGNKDAIKKDIAYANQQINQAIDAYVKKSKTMDDIVAEVLADPRLASYGQTANKSGIFLIGNDGQRYQGTRTITLRGAFYENVKKSLQTSSKPEVFEDRISMPMGLDMPEVDRPDSETAVAYYFLVTEPITQKQGIDTQYQKLSKEYVDGAL